MKKDFWFYPRDEKEKELDIISREIIRYSKDVLTTGLIHIVSAISQLSLFPHLERPDSDEEETTVFIGTDGRHFFYEPRKVISLYRRKPTEGIAFTRAYLHTVMHCIFQHVFVSNSVDREYWNLACDVAAEYAVSNLGLECVRTPISERQYSYFNEVKNEIKFITAEKLYKYYCDTKPDEKTVASIRAMFYNDDHDFWYMTENELAFIFGESNGDSLTEDEMRDVTDKWKSIASKLRSDIENFSGKAAGDEAGDFIQNLNDVTREKYDYSAYLRRFAVLDEVMKCNEDEFDYITYAYGLEHYGNIALIEPLEYRDEKRIKEFVIAIDTSGSVYGELVQKFIQKTYNILKSENFSSQINVYIIQCDAKIQEEKKITSQEEFDDYIKTMQLKGFGGTRFTPVFDRVNELIENGEFTNLGGLIYLTDGYADYPTKMTPYETAFVFVEDGYNEVGFPPWATKLVFTENELAEEVSDLW